jgi:hypothetical protein
MNAFSHSDPNIRAEDDTHSACYHDPVTTLRGKDICGGVERYYYTAFTIPK